MPEYIAKGYLIHNGEIVEPEGRLELSAEQAEALNREVENVELAPEAKLQEKTVPELKEEAKAKGVEGYAKMTKEQLVEALAE